MCNDNTLKAKIQRARDASVPLVAIESADPAATREEIREAVKGDDILILGWDIAQGVFHFNEKGKQYIAKLGEKKVMQLKGNPHNILANLAPELPSKTVLIVANAGRYINDNVVCQAVWNLRDKFKRDRRMLFLISTAIKLPIELVNDVVVLDDPLPTDDELTEIVTKRIDAAGDQFKVKPTKRDIARSSAALRGTSQFAAEQLTAMSLRLTGIDQGILRTQSKKMIEQTRGLHVEDQKLTFDDIGGLDQIKQFGSMRFNGPNPPAVILRIEELEKAMAGVGGETSGTSDDALQVLLSAFEDNNWSGILAYGGPGTGKSLFAKALANTFGALPMRFDINATKEGIVGSSGENIRQAIKVIETIGGAQVFAVASVNKLDKIPPELQRRFRAGVWFFDVPSEEELAPVWDINLKRYGLTDDPLNESDLTGSDIRNICEGAYENGVDVRTAFEYIVPTKVSSPDTIDECRRLANGRFLSASYKGTYRMPGTETNVPDGERAVSLT